MQAITPLRATCTHGAVRSNRLHCPTVVTAACKQRSETQQTVVQAEPNTGRREFVLNSVNLVVLGSLFSFGAAPRPANLGVQDYSAGVKTLALCPSTPNCIATSEEVNDPTHFVPPWTYSPQDGRGIKGTVPQSKAMAELKAVVEKLKPEGFEPKIISETDNYLYVEYSSPTFGFIDDVEFWFKPGPGARVEYRSASRIGESDGDVNRKRIRAIRQELEKKGWASVGY
mmetsp:Transcript_17320/g.29599  ORF Transcript_17320/g.29599 Transcript_17320/m.29599 type:complete len:228 (-) Transcript_17320:278-961(-)|eukprot:CAMPEP_0119106626 /NCGR_PEP_ID=MMETSP1180-20130426/5405_1 /TAXON_ID=3052 ORGANISM="Chlamydomonas cf sp, Strain CCMP681" /NCGR_SAMPLE_ID=MMETSP1180 /ASSEMBLY_ACC=CAM_ASM_000741 /LENGTH=227 /DNA_ID=CAMNT_0007091991 /DNA_START=28 /DNA_END=711 /DNA_ORIENTATION=+